MLQIAALRSVIQEKDNLTPLAVMSMYYFYMKRCLEFGGGEKLLIENQLPKDLLQQ